MRYIFKLNIYSMLLTVILAFAIFIELNVEVLSDSVWKLVIFWAVWGYIAFLTLKIYGRFRYKVETLQRLVEKGREKYDFRLFYPYMDTACMRHVVYFSLCELGRRQDYTVIKHNFLTKTPDTRTHTAARVVRTVYEDGRLRFEVKSASGEWSRMV